MNHEGPISGYELRRGILFVGDEPVPIDPFIFGVALRGHQFETGEDFGGADGPIPLALAKRILRLERYRSLLMLAEEMIRAGQVPHAA